jgi:hypothetical protein
MVPLRKSCRIKIGPTQHGQFKKRLRIERFAGNALLQRLALEQFHRDEGLAIGFIDLIQRADM